MEDARAIVPVRDDKNVSRKSRAKKKRGGLNLLRAAMHMLRRRHSAKKSKPLYAEVASVEVLNKVVGSIRPLHAQSNESPPHDVAPATFSVASFPSPTEQFEDVQQTPASPDHSLSTSDGGTSRYASTLNLQDLDTISDDEEEEEDENKGEDHEDNGTVDEMIDLKADEFIARFYEQMKIQNQNEMERRRNKHRQCHTDHY